jgi:hypothetical protein
MNRCPLVPLTLSVDLLLAPTTTIKNTPGDINISSGEVDVGAVVEGPDPNDLSYSPLLAKIIEVEKKDLEEVEQEFNDNKNNKNGFGIPNETIKFSLDEEIIVDTSLPTRLFNTGSSTGLVNKKKKKQVGTNSDVSQSSPSFLVSTVLDLQRILIGYRGRGCTNESMAQWLVPLSVEIIETSKRSISSNLKSLRRIFGLLMEPDLLHLFLITIASFYEDSDRNKAGDQLEETVSVIVTWFEWVSSTSNTKSFPLLYSLLDDQQRIGLRDILISRRNNVSDTCIRDRIHSLLSIYKI